MVIGRCRRPGQSEPMELANADVVINVTSKNPTGGQGVDVEKRNAVQTAVPAITGPVIVGVRGPSRSGKTALVERLIAEAHTAGWKVGWVKRTHHQIDLPEKASGSVWATARHDMQRQAYAIWPSSELFQLRPSALGLSEFEKPGKPRRRVLCVDCAEEVSDGREIETQSGARCRPCAVALELEG